jgi:hypothetical protein
LYNGLVPTVLRLHGYRIGFYSADAAEPPHVHVVKAGSDAKFWLQPLCECRNKGFKDHELREIAAILKENQQQLLKAWNECFKSQPPTA